MDEQFVQAKNEKGSFRKKSWVPVLNHIKQSINRPQSQETSLRVSILSTMETWNPDLKFGIRVIQ